MNLNYLEYWPGVLLAFLVFVVVTIMLEGRFFKVIKTYWFFRRSLMSYVSTFFFLCGMGLLLTALMDLRGPEEKIKQNVPSDRTIILIDTSASMLAEDIKPSRLQKAVLIAKHFARKAAGHQISVVAFAEIQKKIVPFTNDLELIDARLESLKNLRNQYGSSALTMALQESLQYFKETGDAVQGNILVLTDGEETADGIDLKLPKEVRVAFVGIGTTQGGRIPMDDSRGFRFGYKKDRGQDVITKFNEEFFKRAVSDLATAKYWVASSYSLPSEEILDFFTGEKGKGLGEQDMVIKPVLMEWLVVPAVLLIILSYMFKAIRVFVLGLFLVVAPVKAQQQDKEPQLSPQSIERLGKLQAGQLNKLERLKLADDLYKEGLKPEALTLYQENLNVNKVDRTVPPEAYLNYGTALLEQGQTGEGLETYEKLLKSLKNDPEKSKEIQGTVEKNIVTHFQQMEQKEQQKKDKQNQQKDQQDNQQQGNQDQKQDQGQGQNNNQQNQPQSGQGQKDKEQQQGKDPEQNKNKKNDGEGEEKDQKEKNDKKNENEGDENKDSGEKEKNLPPRKLPAKLKQLMSDDRQIQMKMIEHGTREMNKRKSRRSKDW